mmetsp:Transcript_13166/g.20073  ORF Transcript_13166/g.20073 Transcript_13166/m.20073 type:complete len:115 (+) Transcript_13166:1526-1870(+)
MFNTCLVGNFSASSKLIIDIERLGCNTTLELLSSSFVLNNCSVGIFSAWPRRQSFRRMVTNRRCAMTTANNIIANTNKEEITIRRNDNDDNDGGREGLFAILTVNASAEESSKK